MKACFQNKKVRIALCIIAAVILLCVLVVLICNLIVIATAHPYRTDTEELSRTGKRYDCILVLGAGIKDDGTPSNLLRDRLNMGLTLLENGAADVLLLTGDSRDAEAYDEVGCMANYLTGEGVSETQIVRDPLGLSTYDSLWRAKYVYGMESVLIVTQNFHLSRALYYADALGLECAGVECDVIQALPMNYIREFAACVKAVFTDKSAAPSASNTQSERTDNT